MQYEKALQDEIKQQKAEVIAKFQRTKDVADLVLLQQLNSSMAASRRRVVENS